MTRIPWRSGYCGKVISLGPIAHWPLYDLSGTVARNSMNTFNTILDGAYTGATLQQDGIGDGFNSVLFDGATNLCNVYSSGIASLFNGSELTLSAWIKVSSASVWTDGVFRYVCLFQVDANNTVGLFKGSGANSLRINYIAGGTAKNVSPTYSAVTWTHMAVTVSKSGDAVKGFVNGVQSGATQTGLGVWSNGALDSTRTIIGAGVTTPTLVWSGNLAHVALWNRALTQPEITALATVP